MAGGPADTDGTWPEGPGGRRDEAAGTTGAGGPANHGGAGATGGAADHVPPDSDGSDGGWPGWDVELPAGFAVPDDARELDADRQAWLRDQRRARARRRLLSGPPGSARPTLLLLLLVAALVSGVSAVSVMLVPRPPQRQLPLAATYARDGDVGGLLPDVRLQTPTRTVPVRAIRPAVLVVLPTTDCACAELVRETVQRAGVAGVGTWLVLPERDAAGEELAATARQSRGMAAVDPSGAIGRAVGATGPVLVLVAADGVITEAEPVASADEEAVGRWLDQHVAQLHRPGAVSGSAASATG
ncbi:hypothetical protein [Motilibacter deserti]|uniref:Thioredoxin domain-containing protein n=1 Tax=Motilibacter deserti TaxID=2714956 RepID=A0ABX0GVP5_9ACTN|nr:hypothetical protein [Motilibacter deserti]NHC15013.1 hypothetical protein [Motilibacter deserti]